MRYSLHLLYISMDYNDAHLIDEEQLSTYYHNPKNFDELLLLFEAEGFEIKHCKHIAIKGSRQKRFIRLDSLGEGFDQESLLERFEEKSMPSTVQNVKK